MTTSPGPQADLALWAMRSTVVRLQRLQAAKTARTLDDFRAVLVRPPTSSSRSSCEPRGASLAGPAARPRRRRPGRQRTLEAMDWDGLGPGLPPRVLVGYSDVTAVLEAVAVRLGWASVSGPMAAIGRARRTTRSALFCAP